MGGWVFFEGSWSKLTVDWRGRTWLVPESLTQAQFATNIFSVPTKDPIRFTGPYPTWTTTYPAYRTAHSSN